MLNLLLSRLYLADVTMTACLVALRIADVKLLDGTFFYPGHATAWTWALWITFAITIAPWAFLLCTLGVTEALRRTVGVPSEVAGAQTSDEGRQRRKVLPFRRPA